MPGAYVARHYSSWRVARSCQRRASYQPEKFGDTWLALFLQHIMQDLFGTETYACKERFSCLEHFRRHMRTVHRDRKDKICKFLGCKKVSRVPTISKITIGRIYVQLRLEVLERMLCPKEQDVYDRAERRLHACRKLGTSMKRVTLTATVK